VPSTMVATMGDPEFMSFMVNFKERESLEGPLIMLLEDADKCLVRREKTDMASISTMLNMSDGILGELLDLRIIATTNAMETEFDPAITRAGRLSAHVKVGTLSIEQANSVLKRLVPDTTETALQECKLTHIYKMAYDLGWRPLTVDEREAESAKKIADKPTLLTELKKLL